MRRTAVSLFVAAAIAVGVLAAQVEAAVTSSHNRSKITVQTFVFQNENVATADNAAAGANGSVKILDFPAGAIRVLGVTSDLALLGSGGVGTSAAVVCSFGTTAAAADNATLTTTEADVTPSTVATLTTFAGACDSESTITLSDVILDGTTTPVDLYLNFAIPDAGSSAVGNIRVNGSATVAWLVYGDN